MQEYLLIGVILYLFAYGSYLLFSYEPDNRGQYGEARRYFLATLFFVLSAYMINVHFGDKCFWGVIIVVALWVLTYPFCLWQKMHRTDLEYHCRLDGAFGLYSGVMLFALIGVISLADDVLVYWFVVVAEWILIQIPLMQVFYYLKYDDCISEAALRLVEDTNYNEAIEYFMSLNKWYVGCVAFVELGCLYGFYWLNCDNVIRLNSYGHVISLIVLVGILAYLFVGKKALFFRTAVIKEYLTVKNYAQELKVYNELVEQRRRLLRVRNLLLEKMPQPKTFVLVIGESESRDYMSAFAECEHDTTPWLREQKQNDKFFLFKNAYAIYPETVTAVQHAITECNQYVKKEFSEAVSLLDITKLAGYKIYWYSNQGHLGGHETPVTLLAEIANVAKWTKQELGKPYYDEELLKFLDEVNVDENNFVVLHLKGNHFNYQNRYPKEFTKWGEPGVFDRMMNYANSVAYTDHILQRIWQYGRDKLNMQAMIYFSDHATIPDRDRAPNFAGFGDVRIPLFIYCSDEYKMVCRDVVDNLERHKDYPWTNDLAFELICDIMRLKYEGFCEENSLASEAYKYTWETLMTDMGRRRLVEDREGVSGT